MRRADWDHEPWHILPFNEEKRVTYRRANLIIISILAFFVVGLFVLALGAAETRLIHASGVKASRVFDQAKSFARLS
jgi:hypothetical protein